MTEPDPEREGSSDAADERYVQELEQYRRRLDGAMFAGNLAWWEMDVETGAVTFHENKADMLGMSPSDFEQYEDFTDLLHPDDRERAMEAMRDHLEGRADRYDLEYRIRTADHGYRWFHDLGGITERSADGSPVKVTGIVVDITRRKEMERRLRQKNEELTLLNRIVRHDIRNDMSVALGWSQELEAHLDEEGRSILDRIQSTHRHAVELTRVVRDFVETLGTDDQAELEPTDLGVHLQQELDKREGLFPDVAFVLEDGAPSVAVEANELLSSVFRNVLNNAAQHNDKDDPRVEVGVEAGEQSVVVRVADNGPGIPDERKDAVFGRSEEGLDDPAAGIGLYLVDTLVESYGGEVRVEDNDPEGSVFVIELRRAGE